jgi:hypothetical protein
MLARVKLIRMGSDAIEAQLDPPSAASARA